MQSIIFSISAAITFALVPFFSYLVVIVVAAAAFRFRAQPHPGAGWGGKFFFVIPAHDEAESIERTVTSLRTILSQDPARSSIWVIADNCTDRTAEIAAAAGARVLERKDPAARGKGYALAFFFSHLLSESQVSDQDAVVVIDADTRIDRGLPAAFAHHLAAGEDWLQGFNAIGNPQDSWRNGLLSYAFTLVNGTWLMGLDGLRRSVPLRGLAMCFTVRGLRRQPWSAFGLAEDFEFGWILRLAGERVRFVPDAAAFSEIVTENPDAIRKQRQRWESGRKGVRSHFTRRVLRSASLTWGEKIFSLLELRMPTLSQLAFWLAIAIGVNLLAPGVGAADVFVLARAQVAMIATLTVYFTSPLWLLILPLRSASYLFFAPFYMLWKVSLLFRKAPTTWIRTARGGSDDSVSRGPPNPSNEHRTEATPSRRSRRYVLITPCRNEAAFARKTLESVAAQTVLPALWVIVDDGSTDGTASILEEYVARLPYLRIVRNERHGPRQVGPGVVDAFNVGYRTIDLGQFDYLCKLDCDLDLPKRYFEMLIERMEATPRLGTCSGKPYFVSRNGRLMTEGCGDEVSVGASKLYRAECFREIGGFLSALMWDGIDCHRCRMLGWTARSWDDPELRFVHLRPMGSSQGGLLAGRARHGAGQYFMGTGLAYMTASALYRMTLPPRLIGGLAMLWGYVSSMIRREPRYADPAFRKYLRRYQWECLTRGKARATRRYEKSSLPS